jgi:hypothetical protein
MRGIQSFLKSMKIFAYSIRLNSVMYSVLFVGIVVLFQNCNGPGKLVLSDSLSSLQGKFNISGGGSGNGEPYEGKPTGEYVRYLPNNTCDKIHFEVLKLDTTTEKPSVLTTSPIDCQTKPRRLSDEVIEFSKNRFIGSVADGVFIDKDFAKATLQNKEARGWCHTQNTQNDTSYLDVLLVSDPTTKQVSAQIFIFDALKNTYSSVDSFSLNFAEDKFSQTYTHPAFDLKIATNNIKNSNAGSFEASLNMLLDEKRWSQNMSCRLAGRYDGAIWPAKPLLSGPLEGLTYSNPKKLFFFGLFDLPYTQLSLFNFDPFTKILHPLSLPFLKDEVVSSFNVSQENDLMNFRTRAPTLGVNRFMTYSVDNESVVYQSDPKEQVTEFGFSPLGPWYYSRIVASISSTGTMFYASGENLHYPLSQQYIPEPIVFPGKDKLLDFELKDVDFKNSKALIRVALGEKVTWSSDHKYLFMQFRNLYDDLALYDFKTTEFKMLEIGKRFGSQTHLSDLVRSRAKLSQLNGDWVSTVVSDASSYKVVKYNLVTNETKIIAESPVPTAGIKQVGSIGFHAISRQALYFSDKNQYIQVLDLKTEKLTPLFPVLQIANNKIQPMMDSKNKLIMYWLWNQDKSLSPIIFDFSEFDLTHVFLSQTYLEAKLYFDQDLLKQAIVEGKYFPLVFDTNIVKTPDNYLLFQADRELNGKLQLYSLNLVQPNEPLQLLSNRYYPYGGVEKYIQTEQNELYLLMSNLPLFLMGNYQVNFKTKYLLKWNTDK